jgi:regulator of replication initiation timing
MEEIIEDRIKTNEVYIQEYRNVIKDINKKIRKLNKQNHNLRIEMRRLKKNGYKEGDIS